MTKNDKKMTKNGINEKMTKMTKNDKKRQK